MALQAILTTANSGLQANASRVSAIANNIINVNTPGFKTKDVRTTTLATEQTSRTNFTPGGIQAAVIQEEGPVNLVSQFTRLIQSEAAFSASAELLRTADELQRELVYIKA
jgi:flagellar basal-body rod protein FlgC